MGQRIEVTATVVDDVVMLDTDRSITGQDGTEYPTAEEAGADDRFPGRLAARVFEADEATAYVFVSSNSVVVRRRGGWTDAETAAVSKVVSDFFLFYPL